MPAAYGIEAKLPDSLAGQLAYPLLAEPPMPAQPETADAMAAPRQKMESVRRRSRLESRDAIDSIPNSNQIPKLQNRDVTA
jgi:hypothetical protein